MRIVSLLASGTEIVCALGAGDQLVGRSHECDNPAWVRTLPCCSQPAFDVNASSRAIDTEVSRRVRLGEPLYVIHTELVRSLKPDLLITQSHCNVCAITPGDVERGGLDVSTPNVLALSAGSLQGIFEGIQAIARAIGRDGAGVELVAQQRTRLDRVRARTAGLHGPTVAMIEWTDPMFTMGNWGPELVEIANGQLMLGEKGQYSRPVSSEELRIADPEHIIVAPCGFDLERTLGERVVLEAIPGWQSLRAVQTGKVALADGNLFFNRSGMTVAQTAEIIAEILHGVVVECPSQGIHWRWCNN